MPEGGRPEPRLACSACG
ncbi:hypothetical protein [Kribbella shirazensis]